MRDLHGRIRGVDPLPARATGAADADIEVLRLDHEVDFLGLGQHGHRGRGGVDAALRFGRGHALDTMDAAFVAQFLVHVGAVDLEDDFLDAAFVAGADVQGLGLQPTRSA